MIILCQRCQVEIQTKASNRKYCDTCRPIATKEDMKRSHAAHYQKNADVVKAKVRAYQHDNREAILARKHAAYHSKIEEYRARDRARFYGERRKQSNAHSRAYYKAHREEQLIKCAVRYAANPAPAKAQALRWRKANPEKVNAFGRVYRVRKANAEGNHTLEQFWTICEHYQWKCVYCNCLLTKRTASEDHATPLSKGGSDFIDNILPSCISCNARKGARTYDQYMNDLREKSS